MPPQCGYWGSMGSFCSAPQDFGLLGFFCARFPPREASIFSSYTSQNTINLTNLLNFERDRQDKKDYETKSIWNDSKIGGNFMLARRTWASLVSFLAHLTDKYFKNIFRTPPKFPRNSPSSTCKATCFKLNFVLSLYSREILHINVFLNKFFNPP